MSALLPPIPENVLLVSGCVLATASTGSLVAALHPRLQGPEKKTTRQAVHSWWPPTVVACVTCVLGLWVALAAFAIIGVWVLYEYRRMMPAEDHAALALGFGAVPLVHLAFATGYGAWAETGLLALLFLAVPLVRGFVRGPAGVAASTGRVGLGIALSAWSLGHVARVQTLPVDAPGGPAGLAGVLLLGVMFSDIGQYAFGKMLGKRLLVPTVSPKKTWEGFVGGMGVSASVLAVAAPALTPWSAVQGALLGVALAVFGLLGDLLASMVKRDFGVKDSGAVLPGQGGVLDRADSLLLTAPLYFHFAAWAL